VKIPRLAGFLTPVHSSVTKNNIFPKVISGEPKVNAITGKLWKAHAEAIDEISWACDTTEAIENRLRSRQVMHQHLVRAPASKASYDACQNTRTRAFYM
jgi:hypothetical protein